MDFMKFMKWATKTGYRDDLTIDRINPDGNYSPDNCRWSTNLEQQRNKRTSVSVSVNGVSHCIPEWAEIIGVNKNVLYKRLKNQDAVQKYIEERL